MQNNGLDPDSSVLKLGHPGADLLWDLSGYDNSWDQPDSRSMPPIFLINHGRILCVEQTGDYGKSSAAFNRPDLV